MKHETYIKIYEVSQWIFIIFALIFIFDGLFLIPLEKTRYGFNNIGLDMGMFFIGISAYFMLIKRIHKLEIKCED